MEFQNYKNFFFLSLRSICEFFTILLHEVSNKLYFIFKEGTPIPKSGPCIASCRNNCSSCPNVFERVPVCLKLIQSILKVSFKTKTLLLKSYDKL